MSKVTVTSPAHGNPSDATHKTVALSTALCAHLEKRQEDEEYAVMRRNVW